MKKKIILFLFLISGFIGSAQGVDWIKHADSVSSKINENEQTQVQYLLPDMVIDISAEQQKQIRARGILRKRILRVYPYVQATADNLIILNENLNKMQTKGQKRKYLKRAEAFLNKNFKNRLKRLSRNDGKILIKLINRQTGKSAFELLREFKSGWSAYWSHQMAKFFDLNLKATYNPSEVLEDFYIEHILRELKEENLIDYREPKITTDIQQIRAQWKEKLGTSGYFPE